MKIMHPIIERRSKNSGPEDPIQKSLSACLREGVLAQIMISTMDNYLIPLGLVLGATSREIGFLAAFPNLAGSFSQLLAIHLTHKIESRLKLLLIGVFIQALFIVPIGLLCLTNSPHIILALIFLGTAYKIISNLLAPAWGSLVSEYLPAHRRGHYFGYRARVISIWGVFTVIFWGSFLYFWQQHHDKKLGFMVVFLVAALFRFISLQQMKQLVDLPINKSKENEFTFWMFLKRWKESNFVRFIFYISSITFTTYIAAPFFSVHMLRDLKFNYLEFTLISIVSTISALLAFPIWGKHADQVGNAKVLKTTSAIIPLIPFIWMFIDKPFALIPIELLAGFVWGGFNLCAINFIYDAVTPAKRVRCLGYFHLINGIALFSGSILGAYLVNHIPPLFGHPLLWLFAISGTGRLISHILFSPQFKEVRPTVKTVSSLNLFFSVAGLRPILGEHPGIPFFSPRKESKFGKTENRNEKLI